MLWRAARYDRLADAYADEQRAGFGQTFPRQPEPPGRALAAGQRGAVLRGLSGDPAALPPQPPGLLALRDLLAAVARGRAVPTAGVAAGRRAVHAGRPGPLPRRRRRHRLGAGAGARGFRSSRRERNRSRRRRRRARRTVGAAAGWVGGKAASHLPSRAPPPRAGGGAGGGAMKSEQDREPICPGRPATHARRFAPACCAAALLLAAAFCYANWRRAGPRRRGRRRICRQPDAGGAGSRRCAGGRRWRGRGRCGRGSCRGGSSKPRGMRGWMTAAWTRIEPEPAPAGGRGQLPGEADAGAPPPGHVATAFRVPARAVGRGAGRAGVAGESGPTVGAAREEVRGPLGGGSDVDVSRVRSEAGGREGRRIIPWRRVEGDGVRAGSSVVS